MPFSQAGVDGGGLSREWAVEIMKIIVSSSSGLFQMEEDGAYYGNQCSEATHCS